MLQDLRYGLRQLKKNPGFATIAVLTLALGIAAVTTVFTWANAVFFNPWPLVRAANEIRTLGGRRSRRRRLYLALQPAAVSSRTQHHGFAETAAHEMFPVDLAGGDARPERYWAGIVSSNYFQMLGVNPALGTDLRPP